MATTTIDYLHYFTNNGKEVRKRYPQPVPITKARTDAIRLLRAGKVGEPPVPFAMTCVVLSKDTKARPDGEDAVEQIILQRAVSGNSGIFYCARAWSNRQHEWIWLSDSGRTRTNVQPW